MPKPKELLLGLREQCKWSRSLGRLIPCLGNPRPLGQRGSSLDPSSTVQETAYLEPLWVWKTMYRRLGRPPLALLTLSATSIVCRAVISSAPLTHGRDSRIHTEMHRHSYPNVPEAKAAASSGRPTPAPSLAIHRPRCKSAVSSPTLRSVVSWDGASRRHDRGTSIEAVLTACTRIIKPSETHRHHFRVQACRRSTPGAGSRRRGKRTCQTPSHTIT